MTSKLQKSHRKTAAALIRHIRKQLRMGRCDNADRDFHALLEHALDIRYSASTIRSIRRGLSACRRKRV